MVQADRIARFRLSLRAAVVDALVSMSAAAVRLLALTARPRRREGRAVLQIPGAAAAAAAAAARLSWPRLRARLAVLADLAAAVVAVAVSAQIRESAAAEALAVVDIASSIAGNGVF